MLVSKPEQEPPLSPDTRDLLIRSTRAHLRVQRHEPGPMQTQQRHEPGRVQTQHRHEPGRVQTTEPPAEPRPSRAPPPPGEEELQTIRLAAGGRGAGLEALRQRSHCAPQRQPVRITLRDCHSAPGQDSNSHSAPGQRGGTAGGQDYSFHDAPGENYSNNMESVSELTETVQRLLQQYRGQAVTEETLHRLETLHNQQLSLQNQLLDSALKMAMRSQAPPPAAGAMETLPVAVAPPCCCDRVTHSLSPAHHTVAANTLTANQKREEAGFGAEQVLMEMERLRSELKSVLTQRQEPEKPPQARPKPSPSKQTQLKTSRTFQNPLRAHRVPQSSVSRPQHTRSQRSPAQTPNPPNKTSNPPHTSPGSPNPPNISPGSVRKPKSAEVQEQDPEQGPKFSRDRASGREEEDGNHQHYTSYLQNRIEVKQKHPQKVWDGAGRSEKWTQSEREDHKTEKDGAKMEGQKENTVTGLGLGYSGGPRLVLPAPEGPVSVLDQARSVLKKVQRQRKVLEENLESQLRARSGELLLCQLNALSQDRDCSEQVRIKKTVDGFIRDIQAEMKTSAAKPKASANRINADRRPSAPSANRNAASWRNLAPSANRNIADRRNPSLSGQPIRTNVKPARDSPLVLVPDLVLDPVLDPEERLRRLYGNAPHHGQRRSLKRSPYLRLSSPVSPNHRPHPHSRPRLLQTLKGVKLKSCKTQTPGSDPGLSPGLSRGLSPGLSPALSPGPVRSSVPAVEFPLGRPRKGPTHRAPQEVTSLPRDPSPPPLQQEVTSQVKSPPLKEVTSDEHLEQESVQSSDPPLVNIFTPSPQQQEEAEFSGTHFLSVAELQQSEAEGPEGPEQVLQLEGVPSPDLVQYQGPQFPPLPPPAQDQSPGLDLDFRRAALEEQLVQWVEQQIMSRIISDMSRPQLSDPTHSPYTSQSEPPHRSEPAHTPSLVQSEPSAASDHSFQLQVESGLDLDPEQVQGLVLEVLTEIVAVFLGSREPQDPETGPGSGPGPGQDPAAEIKPQTHSETQETLIPTPLATPPQTPPLVVKTPSPACQSLPFSSVETPRATPPLADLPSPKEGPPPEPVTTPPPTPVAIAELSLVQTEKEESEATPPPECSPAPAVVAPPPGPPSPPETSSSSSSSTVSSRTSVTAPRHISEGEVLLSLRHVQERYEENVSFSSSLQELQDMDLDPPSEGQVHSSSVLLNFITKLQQREPRPQPEGSWGQGLEEEEEVSAGEIKDDVIDHVTNQRSPGQTSPITGEALEWTNQSAASEGLLTSDLLLSPLDQASAPKQNSDLGQDLDQTQTQTQQSPERPPDQDQDQQKPQTHGEEGAEPGVWGEGGPLKVDVFIPALDTETSGGSDSSSDVF